MQIEQDIMLYLDVIDEQYRQGKGSISRLDPEWGTWSRGMNLEIRAKLENKESPHPQPMLLKLVTLYWLQRSRLLELHFKSKLHGQVKKRRLLAEIKKTREDILGNRPSKDMSTFDLQKMILDGELFGGVQ